MAFFRKARSVADPVRELFDDEYYRLSYPDVSDPAVDRYAHFMTHGWREGRNPSAAFDTLFYRDRHLGGATQNPLAHYAAEGRARGLATVPADAAERLAVQRPLCAPYFDEAAFRAGSRYEGPDALGHFLAEGWRGDTRPSIFHDQKKHMAGHSHVNALDVSPLYHFASQRRFAGIAPPLSLDLRAPFPDGTLVASVDTPALPLAPPRLVELEPIPPAVRDTLAPIWSSGTLPGRAVRAHRLRDVVVAAEGLVFTREGRLLEATRTHHSEEEVRDAALAVADALRRGGPERVIGHGVLAESRGAGNYGHFILEMLPRAWFARTRLGIAWPAIIHASSIARVAREALACAGFGPDEVELVGRDPVAVGELLVVDGLASHPLHVSALALDCFAELAAPIGSGPRERIYVPRGPVVRDFADEPAVAAALAAAGGFVRRPTATLPFADQVALFAGASHVVGVTGAALTNTLFCRPGARVTVFSPAGAAEVLFWLIASLRGLDYVEIRCRAIGEQQGRLPWDRTLDVEPNEVVRQVA